MQSNKKSSFSVVINFILIKNFHFFLGCHLDEKWQKIFNGKAEMKGFYWSLKNKSLQKLSLIKPRCKAERQWSLQWSLRRCQQKIVPTIYTMIQKYQMTCAVGTTVMTSCGQSQRWHTVTVNVTWQMCNSHCVTHQL